MRAVFTRGEFATERATASTASARPRTITRAIRSVPSPSATISSASWRISASSASPRAISSAVSGSTATPEAPPACTTTVSLVESWPSTVMRSKERFTHTPVSRSTVSGCSSASVCTKQNIVAWRGEIIPAPLAWADEPHRAARAAPPPGRPAWAPRSLVMIASENVAASSPSRAAAARTPASTGSRGSSVPITPVDATRHAVGLHPQRLGRGGLHGHGGLEAAPAVAHVRVRRVGHHGT